MLIQNYMPQEGTHIVQLTFRMGTLTSKVVARMGGNSHGGDIISCYTDLFSGLSVRPCDGENEKYCMFEEEDVEKDSYEEVEYLKFYPPNSTKEDYEEHDLDFAEGYLVAIEIIGFESEDDDDE